MWLSYEELEGDLEGAVRRIAAFCGVDVTPEVVAGTVKASSFSKMKQVFLEQSGGRTHTPGVLGLTIKNHIREGKAGAWVNTFTLNDLHVIDAHHKERCKRLSLPPLIWPTFAHDAKSGSAHA